MNPASQINRVFILGAGFSKAAGMPDARELTDLILKAALKHDAADFRAWIGDITKRIAQLERDSDDNEHLSLNIEQLFEFAHFDRELYLMKQHECVVGRDYGATPHSQAEAITTWLGHMEEDLVEVLLDAQERADQGRLTAFAENLRPGDTVLTFNYDTLLEDCLDAAGRTWVHGFEFEPSADVTVLKLHGSLDWWLLDRREKVSTCVRLFAKEDSNIDPEIGCPENEPFGEREYGLVLHRAGDLTIAKSLCEMHTGFCSGTPPRPGIGGLGAHKPLHRLVGSGVVWRKAFGALKQGGEVIVVGWSCSPYDIMARFHFSAVMRMREQPPSRTIVVDPYADRISDNVAPVFGELVLVNKRWEHVNWSELLD